MADFFQTLKTATTAVISNAFDWLSSSVQNINNPNYNQNAAINNQNQLTNLAEQNKVKVDPYKVFKPKTSISIGQMFLFSYDAKLKQTLPFFDMYPLVFPLEFYSDGFLGLNLHYLPPLARAYLLNMLKKIEDDNKYTDKQKLNISYKILKAGGSRFPGYQQCIKRYLYNHVKSSFHLVESNNWDKVVLLPLHQWYVNPRAKIAPPY